jgi:hypothetical protein
LRPANRDSFGRDAFSSIVILFVDDAKMAIEAGILQVRLSTLQGRGPVALP